VRTRVVVSFLLFVAACANQRPIETAAPPADAAFRRDPIPSAAPRVLATDAVTAELLRAAFTCHEQRRRVAIENLANVDTWAFKRRVVRSSTRDVVGNDGAVFQVPFVESIESRWTPGVIQITERSLDLAIDGEGFFAVHLVDGTTGYTRAGSLRIADDGKVVTGFGRPILPMITVPADLLCLDITAEGGFRGRTAGSPDTTTMFGSITLHRFVNPSGLRSVSNGVWQPTEASGSPITAEPGQNGVGFVKQGFLERSNVVPDDEVAELQRVERQREALLLVMRELGLVAP